MELGEYLKANNETFKSFARRSLLTQNTIRNVIRGKSVKMITARKISRSTKGDVCLDDMVLEPKSTEKSKRGPDGVKQILE